MAFENTTNRLRLTLVKSSIAYDVVSVLSIVFSLFSLFYNLYHFGAHTNSEGSSLFSLAIVFL